MEVGGLGAVVTYIESWVISLPALLTMQEMLMEAYFDPTKITERLPRRNWR